MPLSQVITFVLLPFSFMLKLVQLSKNDRPLANNLLQASFYYSLNLSVAGKPITRKLSQLNNESRDEPPDVSLQVLSFFRVTVAMMSLKRYVFFFPLCVR